MSVRLFDHPDRGVSAWKNERQILLASHIFDCAGYKLEDQYEKSNGRRVRLAGSKGDALLLGRVSYQSYAAAFSSQTGDLADVMNCSNL